jgi:VanZ family protein
MQRGLLLWRLSLTVALLAVAYASLAPVTHIAIFSGIDKVMHILAYTCLYLLAWRAFPGTLLRWQINVGLLLFGGLLEYLQSLTDYRLMEWADLLANLVGLGLGSLLACFLPRRSAGVPIQTAGKLE